ncbi:hypothetical protein [Actinopolymorpha pittospori]
MLAFNDEGFALVLAEQGQLVRATSLDSFLGVLQLGADQRIVAIAPGGGWRVEYAPSAEGAVRSAPLVGWGVRGDGQVVPLDVENTGEVLVTELSSDAVARIYHPDEQTTAAKPAAT